MGAWGMRASKGVGRGMGVLVGKGLEIGGVGTAVAGRSRTVGSGSSPQEARILAAKQTKTTNQIVGALGNLRDRNCEYL